MKLEFRTRNPSCFLKFLSLGFSVFPKPPFAANPLAQVSLSYSLSKFFSIYTLHSSRQKPCQLVRMVIIEFS